MSLWHSDKWDSFRTFPSDFFHLSSSAFPHTASPSQLYALSDLYSLFRLIPQIHNTQFCSFCSFTHFKIKTVSCWLGFCCSNWHSAQQHLLRNPHLRCREKQQSAWNHQQQPPSAKPWMLAALPFQKQLQENPAYLLACLFLFTNTCHS